MASTFHMLLLLCCLFYSIISSISSKTPFFRLKALVLPVTKDAYTNQYLTQINQRTPLVPVKLTIDLGGKHFWVDCENGYISSTYKPARCHSAQCNLARFTSCNDCAKMEAKPGCNNNTCTLFPYNPIGHASATGELAQDIITIQSTNGFNPGKVVFVPNVIFACSETSLLEDLASGVTGIAGLGRNKDALPSQLAAAFSFKRKFSVCLSSSTRDNGVVIFGDEPHDLLPYTGLTYTPLILNPRSTAGLSFRGEPSADYFIGLKSIKIDDKAVPLNTSLLSIDKEGTGGTKISTGHPYTSLESSIYKAVVSAFAEALSEVPKVKAVAPFGVCFDAKKIGSTRVGPAVPHIDFVLQNEIVWRVYGANSMVRVNNDVMCLGFVDGGPLPFVNWGVKYTPTAVVIGGHQIEDNLLQFDLAASRLGFSSSLLLRQTSCSNFNFTSIA